MSKQSTYIIITMILVAIIATAIMVIACNKNEMKQIISSGVQSPTDSELGSLRKATEWLNSLPLTATSLRGKVVLIDFWTYTCINWLRTLPYVRAWSEKYKDKGLVVIGVHAPEFPFEKNIDNVRREVKEMNIDYPVAIDNEHEIWYAFSNQYWPALYFIDAKGHLRHYQFGEGDYEQSEEVIQQLLKEAGANDIDHTLVSVEGKGAEAAPDLDHLQSPENYTGYERTENFSSPGAVRLNKRKAYTAPDRLTLNQWALSGEWTIQQQMIALNIANGKIVYQFHARDLHLVMGPAKPGRVIKFRVLIDGLPPGNAHGMDVDEQGNGTVTEQRLYQLIRQPGAITDRQFDIEFFDAGVEAFSFTFG